VQPAASKYPLEFSLSLALVVVTALVYADVRNHEFVNLDDLGNIQNNTHVREGLSSASMGWALTSFEYANWHPLTWLSLELDRDLYGGLEPGGFHVTNVVFHLANSVLLLHVLRRMTGALWQSALVAALFALHPLHVESVAWVAERKDVLSTLFWMLTLWAYIAYTERPGLGRYALIVLAFALGLMAKPMLVTLPVVLLLLDYWPLRRWRFASAGREELPRAVPPRRLVAEKLPLLALSVVSCFITVRAQTDVDAIVPPAFEPVMPLEELAASDPLAILPALIKRR